MEAKHAALPPSEGLEEDAREMCRVFSEIEKSIICDQTNRINLLL